MISPIDSGRHVYSNWAPVLEQKGASLPANNAYLRPENRDCQKVVTRDSCQRTLDILSRTAMFGIHTKMDMAFYEEMAKTIKKCVEAIALAA